MVRCNSRLASAKFRSAEFTVPQTKVLDEPKLGCRESPECGRYICLPLLAFSASEAQGEPRFIWWRQRWVAPTI